MNFSRMPTSKDKVAAPAPKSPRKGDQAFDLWLQRGLHQMFDDVAGEPVPEDLLRLIEEDRQRSAPSEKE